tara:strand:+ start:3207 stop:3872 length:666 start_codon:yes stop_codon:yes gene_type:complete
MDYLIHQLIDKKSAQLIAERLLSNDSSWEDGKKTAGTHAAKSKNNLQLDRKSKLSLALSEKVINHLNTDPLIKSFAIPKKFHSLMFTKSAKQQGYGMHVDNPYMSTGRSDLSFTLFLSDQDSYKGGKLNIQTLQENKMIKLSAGEIIIYPSTSLHCVEKITEGERLVCVGWIESYIASNEERNFLFGLDAGAKGLLAKHGRSPELDLIFQAYSNLLRRLGD